MEFIFLFHYVIIQINYLTDERISIVIDISQIFFLINRRFREQIMKRITTVEVQGGCEQKPDVHFQDSFYMEISEKQYIDFVSLE